MSWSTMAAELTGQCPVPSAFTATLVNRAWKDIQRRYDWSFKWLDFSIPTPSATTAGTVTLVRGINQVVGDATATAAWNAIGLVNPITSQQFRIGQGTLYNIIAFDITTNPPFGTLTLDRAYVDTGSGAGSKYQIYQVYYHAPVKNFIWFDVILDPVTGYPLSTTLTRQEVGDQDPQRLQFSLPAGVIPYKIDQTPGNFFGFPMYEIWPAPLSGLTYVATAYLSEKDFDNTAPGVSDIVIPPIDEDVVMEQAKIYGYEWCEANPDKAPKADYQFLMGKCEKECKRLVNDLILKDENFSKRSTIPYAERASMLPFLPWVSQAQNIGVFPS